MEEGEGGDHYKTVFETNLWEEGGRKKMKGGGNGSGPVSRVVQVYGKMAHGLPVVESGEDNNRQVLLRSS